MNGTPWTLRLTEFKIQFEDKEYVLEVGYMNDMHPSLTDSLYIRIWDGDRCICGDYIDPYLNEYAENFESRFGVSSKLIKYCIEKANRIEKLKAFA